MKQSAKALLLSLCAVLLVAASVMGTLAYLTSTDTVQNTFTVGRVSISLDEAKVNDNGQPVNDTGKVVTDLADAKRVEGNTYHLLPGHKYTKDPKVTVSADSEKCYVFVKLEKSTNYGTFLEDYVVADGWTKLDGVDGIYYRVVDQKDEAQDFYVLRGNQVTVKSTVTKADMEGIKTSGQPTLTLAAYACQYYKNNTPGSGANQDTIGTYFTPTEAWNNCTDA